MRNADVAHVATSHQRPLQLSCLCGVNHRLADLKLFLPACVDIHSVCTCLQPPGDLFRGAAYLSRKKLQQLRKP